METLTRVEGDRRTERRIRGDEAESLAVECLERQGFRVLARNVFARGGELDVVAERGELWAFVEVRMRTSSTWGDPSETVSRVKQRRVVRSAMQFLQAHDRGRDHMIRFDVISVVGRGADARVEHIPDAFDAGC